MIMIRILLLEYCNFTSLKTLCSDLCLTIMDPVKSGDRDGTVLPLFKPVKYLSGGWCALSDLKDRRLTQERSCNSE